jgi:hypothetical protein
MIIEISSRLAIDSALTISYFKTWIYERVRLRGEPLPPLPANWRYVHFDGREEREPIDLEPFTVVERRGDFEFVSMPVFRSPNGNDFTYYVVKPRLKGDWEVTDACTQWFPLEDGREQGFWILIRLARGVRS